MGLDMYFEAGKSETQFNFESASNTDISYDPDLATLEGKIFERNFKSVHTSYQIGYFRKFNALHNYIVNEFAGGEDECQKIYLSKEDCEKILTTLESITKENAAEVMPTQDGFFFGGTEYDEWYFRDVEIAIELFKDILDLLNKDKGYKWEIFYQASW